MNNLRKSLLGLVCSLLLSQACIGANSADLVTRKWDNATIKQTTKEFNEMCKFLADNYDDNLEDLQHDLEEIATNLKILLNCKSITQRKPLLKRIWTSISQAMLSSGETCQTICTLVVKKILVEFVYKKGQKLYQNIANKFNEDVIDDMIDKGAKRLGFFVLKILMGRNISNQEREEIVKWLQLFGLPKNALFDLQQPSQQ